MINQDDMKYFEDVKYFEEQMKRGKMSYRYDDAVRFKSAEKAVILAIVRSSISSKQANDDEENKKKYFDGDHWWMQQSMTTWVERMPWLSERTIRRHLSQLVYAGGLVRRPSTAPDGGPNANYYREIVEPVEARA